jgi:hypothetical protein
LRPALGRGGCAAEAVHGVKVQEAARVDWMKGKGRETVQWSALDGDAKRDERIVDYTPSVSK